MNNQIKQIAENNFYVLPFEENTFRLTLKTLDNNSEFRVTTKPRQKIQTRKISYINELLTLGIIVDDEKEEQIYLKVTLENLLVSCSVDTSLSYLSRYAYFALFDLMSIYNYQNFDKYYWPDFFDAKTGKSKYLKIINDRQGLDIGLKPEYNFFYKPGNQLYFPPIEPKINRPIMIFVDKASIDKLNNNGIGFCMADTFLFSWHSNHFPFLITYKGLLTRDKKKMKTILGFVFTNGESPEYSAMQASLAKICQGMALGAQIVGREIEGPQYRVDVFDKQNFARFKMVFELWQDAIQFLVHQPHTHHLNTYGFNNIKMRPSKKYMIPCKFLYEVPKICFLWKEHNDYYELTYRFKVGNKLMVPYERNTAFLINNQENPSEFYLFNRLSDCLITMFFAERKFKIPVLKAHFNDFQSYLNRLRAHFEVEDI